MDVDTESSYNEDCDKCLGKTGNKCFFEWPCLFQYEPWGTHYFTDMDDYHKKNAAVEKIKSDQHSLAFQSMPEVLSDITAVKHAIFLQKI
jgi:hypothetical protein